MLLECRLCHSSRLAYKIAPDGSGGWSVPQNDDYKAIDFAGPPTCFATGTDAIDAGFVGLTRDQWVLVTFRGTLPPFKGDFWAWVDDWLQDFEFGPVSWTVNGQTFGQVEGGFATAMLALWPQVQAALGAIDLDTVKGIIVNGHSKGGALCTLAASLLKSAYPHVLVEACAFETPLVCDATFVQNYNRLGLRPFSVRYQNADDLVPFLPYVPTFDVLAVAERLDRADHRNHVVTLDRKLRQIANDYVPVGILRFITASGGIEYGPKAEQDAWDAILLALLEFQWDTIVGAHSLTDTYMSNVCRGSARRPAAA